MYYIYSEYIIGNALLKKIEDGKSYITLEKLIDFSQQVKNKLNCVVYDSWKDIYNTIECYPELFKWNNDKECIEISKVFKNQEIKQKLKVYFRDGLNKDIIDCFDNISLK